MGLGPTSDTGLEGFEPTVGAGPYITAESDWNAYNIPTSPIFYTYVNRFLLQRRVAIRTERQQRLESTLSYGRRIKGMIDIIRHQVSTFRIQSDHPPLREEPTPPTFKLYMLLTQHMALLEGVGAQIVEMFAKHESIINKLLRVITAEITSHGRMLTSVQIDIRRLQRKV